MSNVRKLIAIGAIFVVILIVVIAVFSYDRIEEVGEPIHVVDGVDYLLSSETVMKSGRSMELS